MTRLAGGVAPARDVLMKKRQFHAMISTIASIDQTQPGLTQRIRVDVLTRTSVIKCVGTSHSSSQPAVQNEY